jgi:hypothetical protein
LQSNIKGSVAAATGITHGAWQLFKDVDGLSHTYPAEYVIPSEHLFSKDDLKAVAAYRSTARLPAVIWVNKRRGNVLSRSSQPRVGLSNKR